MRTWLVILLCGLGLAWTSAVAAPPPVPSPAGRVEVSVAESISEAETTHGWIEERAATVVKEHPLEEGDLVRIDVRGRAFDYEISMVLLRHGDLLSPEHQLPEIACACGSNEMLDRIAEAITAGARTLAEDAQREREEAEKAEKAAQEEAERRKQEEARLAALAVQQTRYRPTKLGRAGIGVLGVGGAVTLSGIIMAVQPPQRVNGRQALARDWTNPGYALLGIGTTAMVGGLTVLIIDVVRCKKDRARCAASAAVWIDGTRWAARASGGAR